MWPKLCIFFQRSVIHFWQRIMVTVLCQAMCCITVYTVRNKFGPQDMHLGLIFTAFVFSRFLRFTNVWSHWSHGSVVNVCHKTVGGEIDQSWQSMNHWTGGRRVWIMSPRKSPNMKGEKERKEGLYNANKTSICERFPINVIYFEMWWGSELRYHLLFQNQHLFNQARDSMIPGLL